MRSLDRLLHAKYQRNAGQRYLAAEKLAVAEKHIFRHSLLLEPQVSADSIMLGVIRRNETGLNGPCFRRFFGPGLHRNGIGHRHEIVCAVLHFAPEKPLFSSARLCSEMSLAILEAPVTRPPASLIGETVNEISIRVPSLSTRLVSQ